MFWQLIAATENIYVAAIVIDYQAALESNQTDVLLDTMSMLGDINGFQEERALPAFICLDVFNPREPSGKIRHGEGSDSNGTI